MPSLRPRQLVSGSFHTDTPYNDYLHTNFVPSEDECRRIYDLVNPRKEELLETIDEIARLQVSLDRMVRKRDSLQGFVDSHLALVSGARRLPHDILGEIFTTSLPENDYAPMDSAESPLLISHICSGWRRLALSMPLLWASLRIEYSSSAMKEGVKSWLARSGTLPLSIRSSLGRKSVLRTLIKSAHRWEHIRFDFSSSHFKPLRVLSPDDLPLLKTVIIDGGSGDEVDPSFLSFLGAPSIRALSLRSSYFEPQELALCATLSHLSLRDLSSPDALAVLGQCLNIETCTLHIDDEDIRRPNPIHLQRLRRLCIVDNNYASNTRLFNHIALPNLESLQYSHTDLYTNHLDPLKVLASAPLLAPEKLTELSLSTRIANTRTTHTLAEVLRRFPMLEKLLLHHPRESLPNTDIIACQLAALLTPSSQSTVGVLCPHLQSICFLGLDIGSDQQMLTLVNARQTTHGVQSLSNLYVTFTRKSQLDIAPALCAAGVTTVLRYPTDTEMEFLTTKRQRMERKSLSSVLSPPPDSLPVQKWRQNPDLDWVPISGEWLADYAEWGLEVEGEELKEVLEEEKPEVEDSNDGEDSE
ncbi:hypothetical protein B0H13DRAFT_2653879 [Mycena leptocephala]|nr:hypothetical protein B0H13DRAFT_2653879 [Mycena leptocephala]